MTQPDRSGSPRGGARNPAQLAFGVLVLLAVASSVVMVFSDSAQLLRLAVVALLWVAVVCSIAVTKYRKDAATSASRAQELQKVYQLELAREVDARREHELVVERDLQEQVHAQLRAESTDDLAGLRAEVKALRESLSELFNGDFLVERVALRAESTRVRALADGSPTTRNGHGQLGAAEDSQVVDAEVTMTDTASPDTAHLGEDEQPAAEDPGAHSAGRSVSELLAAYGGPLSGRRRRRSAD
ncbi:MAG: hypothetical protein M3Y19_04485 [Actinomycetota bacterium]|nr:hypothetical protein [Actinomycetota bacterium]